jgi:hypothetical protein
LEKVDAISSSVIVWEENSLAGYSNLGISDKSAGEIGRKKRAFRVSHLASRMVAGP